mgnify:CR=1 FL=1
MNLFEWLRQQNIRVNNRDLITNAFTHSSFVNEQPSNTHDNERLEFMGDAVLQIWVSTRLYLHEPILHEGQMTTIRAQLVCERALANYSRQLNLNQFILLGHGEEKSGGRNRDSVISDMFEAFIGALYLDSGMGSVDVILNQCITPLLTNAETLIVTDYKTKLQEFVQADLRQSIIYEVVSMKGPANQPEFEVEVKLDHLVMGRGQGPSKKKAEQNAAKDAFSKLVR